jgi:GalNAc5-diNAcBac-PP-undecaprenol beta-1,3-glucosyltransferase
MKNAPRISIIMATYNRAHFIVEALNSIINQSFTNWECLIIDDGGTDNTKEVISPILIQDNRFQYLLRPDTYKKGLPDSRNYGLDLAKGDFVIFFDDDDIVHPDNLKIGLEILETKNLDFCHYKMLSFEVEKPIIQSLPINIVQMITNADIEKVVTQEIGLASCTVLWRKHCFKSIRFNETLLYAEEWECYIRIIAENFKGLVISNFLYFNRKHPHSNTGEYFRNSPIRRESYAKAIVLVTSNLSKKQLLTQSLKRHFIVKAKFFSEYNLFENILNVLNLSTFEKLMWQLFYLSLTIRLPLYRIKTDYKKKMLQKSL